MVVLDGLDGPWDMAFLDDGTMFYTESVRTFCPNSIRKCKRTLWYERPAGNIHLAEVICSVQVVMLKWMLTEILEKPHNLCLFNF